VAKETREEAIARRKAELDAKRAAQKLRSAERFAEIDALAADRKAAIKAGYQSKLVENEQNAKAKEAEREALAAQREADKLAQQEAKAAEKLAEQQIKELAKAELLKDQANERERLAKAKEAEREALAAQREADKLAQQEAKAADPNQLAKLEKKAEFRAHLDSQAAKRDAIKQFPIEEQKAAKKKKRDEDMAAIRAKSEAKAAEKLAEKMNDAAFAAKHAAKAAKRAANEAAMAQREKDKQELVERIGPKVADEIFALKRVRIFENGYIQIGLLGSPEKLASIEADAEVTKKTGLGRAVAAGMTGGLNLLSPNRRGDLTLTVETENDSRVLHTDNPTNEDMKAMKKLESRGNSVLARLAGKPEQQSSSNSSVSTDVSEQLSKLADLKGLGLLDDAEFAAAKAKLLGL
jgi:hypothetical protein